jgi:enoyl-CoA hydratase
MQTEHSMNTDVLSTRTTDGIAVITLGSAKRIYFDAEMGDALTQALEEFAGDANIRVVIITGGAPGYFNRHFSIPALIEIAESLRASGRQWPESATYNGAIFDKAMALCESMPKPVIAAISGTAPAGAFEFALSCDLRIAEDGDYLIGLPEAELGSCRARAAPKGCPVPSGRRPHSCTSSWVNRSIRGRPKEKAWCMKPSAARLSIARRLSSHTAESLGYIKRLVRNATEMPLAQGLALERNLFLKLCVSDQGLARMRSYEEKKITSPSRSIEI